MYALGVKQAIHRPRTVGECGAGCGTQRAPSRTESLKDTVARFLPYWQDVIGPTVLLGKRVLVAAHGNSLRALVKYLDDLSAAEVVELEIPTGVPLVYRLDEALRPLGHEYLATREGGQV